MDLAARIRSRSRPRAPARIRARILSLSRRQPPLRLAGARAAVVAGMEGLRHSS